MDAWVALSVTPPMDADTRNGSHTQRGLRDSSLALSAAEQLTCIVVEVTGKQRKQLAAN